MNKINIDMNKYRAILDTWNLAGKTICCIESDNMDLSHNDKVRNNLLRLSKPLRKYSVKTIDIIAWRLVELPDENGVVIELNGSPDLQFPLGPVNFKEVTMDNVTEAIRKFENEKETTFFRELDKLTEIAVKLNKIEKKKGDDLIEELAAWSCAYDDINKIQVENSDSYYRALGLKD